MCKIAVPFCGTKTSKNPPSLIRRLASGIAVQGGGLRIGLHVIIIIIIIIIMIIITISSSIVIVIIIIVR